MIVKTLLALLACLVVFYLEGWRRDSEVIRGVSCNICGAQRLGGSICTLANRH